MIPCHSLPDLHYRVAKSADVMAQIKNAHTQMDMDRDNVPHCSSNNPWSCVKSEKGKGNQWPLRSVTFCVRAYVCDKQRGRGAQQVWNSILGPDKWKNIDDFGVCVEGWGWVRGKIALQCVCVGGKTSMSSQPLHTAKQIGEVVRSHNMKIQPGDEEGWRQDDADPNVFVCKL